MTPEVLYKIIDSDKQYFLVECLKRYFNKQIKDEREFLIISLPENLRKICNDKDSNTVTVKDMEVFKNTYIEQNIYLKPKFPPFQICVKPLYNAVDVLPIDADYIYDLLSFDGNSLYEYKEFLNEKNRKRKT